MSEIIPTTQERRDSWGRMVPAVRAAVLKMALEDGFPKTMTDNILANVQADHDDAKALIEGAENFLRQQDIQN